MKFPVRIVAPVALAVLCAAVLAGLLWLQLEESSRLIEKSSKVEQQKQDETLILRPGLSVTANVDPKDRSLMHLRQGDLLALQGDWQEAQREYELSVKHGGELPALRKLAQAQLQRRDLDGANATIRKMKSAGGKPEDLLLLESVVSLRSGELVKAREILAAAEDSPQKQYGLALLSIIQGDHTSARTFLGQVSTGWEPVLRSYAKTLLSAYDEFMLFPESPEIHLITLLSRALAQVQECELALPLLVQVTQQKDDYRDAWIVQGYCELTTERAAQALTSLEQAYNIDPQKPEIQYFLGRAHAAAGDHGNAVTFLRYALANGFQPASEVRSHIAKEALANGDGAIALEQYKALIEEKNADIRWFEGFVITAIALGNADDATATAARAVEVWPEQGKAHELVGLAALESQKKDAAVRAFTKAIELDPFLEKSQEKLKELR